MSDRVARRRRAVILDMDGTMLDTEPIYRAAMQRASAESGYPFTDRIHLSMLGKGFPEATRALRDAMGPGFPIDQFLDCYPRHRDACFGEMMIALKPGLMELLDWLDERRLPRAVATSTTQAPAIARLKAAGLLHRFNTVATGDQVERGKPAPDLFLLAARRLEVEPRDCIVMEDSEAGILAAEAAGMTPIMVPDMLAPTDRTRATAHSIVASLNEVIEVVDRLLDD